MNIDNITAGVRLDAWRDTGVEASRGHAQAEGASVETKAEAVVQQTAVTAPSQKDVAKVLDQAREHAARQGIDLDFSIHQDSGKMQVSVMDRESGKLVRKIPEDELLKLAERIREYSGAQGGPFLDRSL